MRAALILCLLFAALVAANASDRPEPLTDRPVPVVKLVPTIGWRLSAVAMMDVDRDAIVLVVEGDVINTSDSERPSPKIRLGLRDGQGKEFFHWTVVLGQPRVKPGDYAPFSARLEAPPPELRSVEITPVDAD